MRAPVPGDTIAAVATAPGKAGIGIVRISGNQSRRIAETLCGRCPPPRYATFSTFYARDATVIDQGLTLFFPAPASFTGEDILEIHAHGSPIVLDMILETVIACGARLAEPGEFSQRAFLNGKLDLVQAEAIADLIDSGSRRAAQAAVRNLQGRLSTEVAQLNERLTNLRVYVEASIDFPEEEIDFLADQRILSEFNELLSVLNDLIALAEEGCRMRDGLDVVIAGPPNAGKSSLLNRLAQQNRAIVTDIPGTTRDLLRESVQIDGLPIHLTDTAGLRESTDAIETEGIKRTRDALHAADLVLLVLDSAESSTNPQSAVAEHLGAAQDAGPELLIVMNKIDLSGIATEDYANQSFPIVAISALTGEGMDTLRDAIKRLAGFSSEQAGGLIARRRHLTALQHALAALRAAQINLETRLAGELLAEDLRLAHTSLAEITGEVTPDDLLATIFSNFCVGK